jgi:cytochrome o ubiquinol oxidase subunit 1
MTYYKVWGTLWHDWLTSIDHKKIGIMYCILGFVMLLRGFTDALMMRAQQATAHNGAEGFCHRTTMTSCSRCMACSPLVLA